MKRSYTHGRYNLSEAHWFCHINLTSNLSSDLLDKFSARFKGFFDEQSVRISGLHKQYQHLGF